MDSGEGKKVTIVESWKSVDLPKSLEVLDQKGKEISQMQERSVEARRRLVGQTNDFRRNEENALPAADLVKLYQKEIDLLTKRARYSESAFVTAYNILTELPDPVQALEELPRLREDVACYREEFQTLKNQEVTIRHTEHKLKEVESERDNAVEKARSEFTNREEELLQSLAVEHEKHEQSQQQLFLFRSMIEEGKEGQQSAMELMSRELEAAHEELAMLRSDRRSNQEKNYGIDDEVMDALKERYEMEINSREEQIRKLSTKAEKLEEMMLAAEERSSQLEESSRASRLKLEEAEEKLLERPTQESYDQLFNRVHILERVHFNLVEELDESESEVSSEAKLLVKRCQHLQDENAKLRNRVEDLDNRVEEAESERNRFNEELVSARKLIRALEDDLQRAKLHSIGVASSGVNDSQSAGTSGGDMLAIVTAQRDRLKKNVVELEKKLRDLEDTVRGKCLECTELQEHNVKLYERIRYIQNYGKERSRGAMPISESDIERKYRNDYERTLNPFQEFSNRERENHIRSMNPIDRITLSLTRLFLSNKHARMMLFLYTLCLHLLVFFVLFRTTLRTPSSTQAPPRR